MQGTAGQTLISLTLYRSARDSDRPALSLESCHSATLRPDKFDHTASIQFRGHPRTCVSELHPPQGTRRNYRSRHELSLCETLSRLVVEDPDPEKRVVKPVRGSAVKRVVRERSSVVRRQSVGASYTMPQEQVNSRT
ncbi:hypothetical protein BJX65DRAFT_287460 [Aspergillus insuetus]